MTKMLELDDGSLVPMVSVQRLKPRTPTSNMPDAFHVIGMDGEAIGAEHRYQVQPLIGSLVPVTGWRIAYHSEPQDSEFDLWTEPLVAFRINGDVCTPITCEGPASDQSYLLVAPDGSVIMPNVGAWDSLDEATARTRARWEDARRAAQVAVA